ncbi:ATP-binding cassette domain-containing protein, partial [Parafrankia sp. EUN1f]|uniref:ATP-binding cassette domain-containing protein n=1 Tax=Parafrankia sp. EUN1f TaxID=102897 RepID=UPI0001C445F1
MSTIAPQTTPAVLEALGVSKRFGATAALADASLRVRQGTVHALLGGNGSGKSTLFKCLAGVHTADAGTVAVRGAELPASHLTARRAHQLGLRFVHQDLGLFDGLTVAENIAIGAGFPTRGGRIRWRALRNRVAGLLDRLEIPATPDTPVGALRPATRTLVAIARALQDQDGTECVLLLDEPTASLPDAESRALMVALRQRAAAGQTIVLVSHRMREVLDVADDFTVFRDGRLARSLVAASPTEEDLVTAMAGQRVPSQQARSANTASVGSASATASASAAIPDEAGDRDPVLAISDLAVGPLVGLELAVAPGEVVGIAGLLGSGRSTTLGAVFGLRQPVAGRVRLAGEDVTGLPTRAMMKR